MLSTDLRVGENVPVELIVAFRESTPDPPSTVSVEDKVITESERPALNVSFPSPPSRSSIPTVKA